MHHLIRYAESEGLRDLHGDVLAANERMLKMCRELGFDIAADPEDLALRKVRLKLPLDRGWRSYVQRGGRSARGPAPWSDPCAAP